MTTYDNCILGVTAIITDMLKAGSSSGVADASATFYYFSGKNKSYEDFKTELATSNNTVFVNYAGSDCSQYENGNLEMVTENIEVWIKTIKTDIIKFANMFCLYISGKQYKDSYLGTKIIYVENFNISDFDYKDIININLKVI